MKSLTDRHRVSHAKLAYLVHSSSAPSALMIPISAIAGFTVAIIARSYESVGLSGADAFGAFIQAIPMNYYNITTILLVFLVAIFAIDLGPMRRHERVAREDGVLFDPAKMKIIADEAESEASIEVNEQGRVLDLVLPIGVLLGVAVISAFVIALRKTGGEMTVQTFLQSTDIVFSLVIGTVVAILTSLVLTASKKQDMCVAVIAGAKGFARMMVSASILFLALVTAEVMKGLGVGAYLAGLVEGNMPIGLLPVLLFIIAAFMSYAMGSTLGTAGLVIPIGAEIVMAIDPFYLIPIIGAVLAGCVFGEHTSPLSDTTIMSSIGSQIDSFDHIATQMPYAVISSVVSLVGYLVLGFTRSALAGTIVTFLMLAVLAYAAYRWSATKRKEEDASSPVVAAEA